MNRYRLFANLATFANAVLGVGAILYALAGNILWAMLLIVSGIAFDGLDGIFSRRSGASAGALGRVADSVADAVTFGLAPAAILILHPARFVLWQPYSTTTLIVGLLFAALAITRLVYFTLRGFQRTYFLGAPTPTSALAVVLLLLLFDVPAFLGTNPLATITGGIAIAIGMILPVPFPKVRRAARVRSAMTVTGAALTFALVPLQFRPSSGSLLYGFALAATLVATAGVLAYYIWGPWTVVREEPIRTVAT